MTPRAIEEGTGPLHKRPPGAGRTRGRGKGPDLLGNSVGDGVPAPIELWARDEGSGPPLLLLHGIGASHTIWNAIVPALAPRFRTIVPDLRGHGRSVAPPDARADYAELEADLVGLLGSKGIDSAHLVGFSAGALLALRMGLDLPSRVRSLTLIGGAAYTDQHTRAVTERWAETYTHEGPEGLALRLLKDLYYPDWVEAHMEMVDLVHEQVTRSDFRAAARWGRASASFDERRRIGELTVPTLIVQAMDDQVVDAAHGRILRQSIAGAQIRILPQTGHMVPLERPEAAAAAITTFVEDVETRRRGVEGSRSDHA